MSDHLTGIQFRQLFEEAPGLYLVLLPDFRIIAVSNSYLNATMTKREQIIGRGLFEVFPDNPGDPAATGVSNLRTSLTYVLKQGKAHTMAVQKYDIRREDGVFEERYWSPLNKPVLNDKNEVMYIIHRVEDVTDFVRGEKEGAIRQQKIGEMEMEIFKRAQEIQDNNKKLLEEIAHRKVAENKFRSLLEAAPDAMIIADRKGIIILVNKQAELLFGYTRDEIVDQTVEKLVPPEYKEKHINHRAQYYEEPRVRSMGAGNELFAVRKDGTKFPVEISLSPLDTSEGLLISAAIRDITERKNTEQAILQLNKELESFTYSVSHDLRAPLRVINGYADILREDYTDKLSAEGQKYLEVIKNNARRMGQLIDDLLNLSHTGRRELITQLTNMQRLVEQVVEEQRVSSGKQVRIKINNIEPAVCDSSLIRQVWINLISNAIKYTGKQEQPQIEVSSEKNERELIYSVADNGAGFDMKYADKLFGVFQRLHRVDEFEGTGIGLALVKRIILKHGGSIWATAEPGKGATFSFSLPAEKN